MKGWDGYYGCQVHSDLYNHNAPVAKAKVTIKPPDKRHIYVIGSLVGILAGKFPSTARLYNIQLDVVQSSHPPLTPEHGPTRTLDLSPHLKHIYMF